MSLQRFKIYSHSLLGQKHMSCPLCLDFLTNSEKYAIDKISGEISAIAERLARDKALKNSGVLYMDYYMMYYRIEYTRLLEERKPAAISDYNTQIVSKYYNDPLLCVNCKTTHGTDFENSEFCFHSEDATCKNCLVKNIT